MLFLNLIKRTMKMDCGPQMEYKRITEDRFEHVIKHLRNSFFMDEPLNKAVGLSKPCEGHPELEKYCYKTLEENMSHMAVTDKDEIAGVVLSGAAECGYVEKMKEELEKSCDPNYKKIYRLIAMANQKADLLRRFDVYKFFDIRVLSVHERFRGKGVAKELIKQSEVLARSCNFKLMKAEATGIFSQRIFKKNGFNVLDEYCYDQLLDECGNPIIKVDLPHTKMELVIKCLNQE